MSGKGSAERSTSRHASTAFDTSGPASYGSGSIVKQSGLDDALLGDGRARPGKYGGRTFGEGIREGCHALVDMAKAAANGKNAMLTLALVVLVLSRTVDQVLYYRLNYSYQYYVWYFSSVILAFPISWLVVWWKFWARPQDITPEMRAFPQYKYAIMALFDTSFNVFSTFPVQHIGGDLSNVLSQAVLPINMLGAAVFLRTRFKRVHYWGALLVVYGIVIKLSPSLGAGATGAGSGGMGWVLLMILAQTPSAASNVYKEIGLKDADLDIWYANAWIGVYQLGWGILSAWTIFIPAFVAPHPPISISELGTYVQQANNCFLGQSVSIVSNDTAFASDCVSNGNVYDAATASCDVNCDQDGTPLQVFCVYIIANLTYNILALYVFKEGSSVLFVVANAVRLPLVDALNAVPFVSGRAQESFGKYDGLALVILVLAIVIYYSEAEDIRESVDRAVPGKEDFANMTVSPKIGISSFAHSRGASQGYQSGRRRASLDIDALRRAAATGGGTGSDRV